MTFLKFISQQIGKTFKGKRLAEGGVCRLRGAEMAARQGLSQKKNPGIQDIFLELKQRLRIEQEEQVCSLRTQSVLPCILSYTELFLLLIITSLTGEKQASSAENTNLTLLPQDKTWQDRNDQVQDLVLPFQGERQGTQ